MAASESFERALKKSIESNVLEGFVDKLSDKQNSGFFLAASPLVARGLRLKMCRPSASTENSRRTREKPLVPRVTH